MKFVISSGQARRTHELSKSLHRLLTRHDGLLALIALGGVLVGVAFSAEQLRVLGWERLVHQGVVTLEAVEAVIMPVAVLVGQILWGNEISTGHTSSERSLQFSIYSLLWAVTLQKKSQVVVDLGWHVSNADMFWGEGSLVLLGWFWVCVWDFQEEAQG